MAYSVITARDLIRLSLQLSGIVDQSTPVEADEEADAMMILNDLLEELSIQSLMVYTIQRQVFTPNVSKQVYTYGPGGDFNAPRPDRIESIYVQLSGDANQTELPVYMATFDQWSDITVKGTASPIARIIWPDYQYPLINCSVFPVPNVSETFIFYVWQTLPALTDPTNMLSMPPGYKKMLRYTLALELAAHYGAQLDPTVLAIANRSVGNIKRLNTAMRKLTVRLDPAFNGKPDVFNYYTGESR